MADVCREPLAREQLLLERSSPACITLIARKRLQFGPSTRLFEPCTPTRNSQMIPKISRSPQSHRNHLISEVSSADVKGLRTLESSTRNTRKGDVLAPLKVTAELPVTLLGTRSHPKHLPSRRAF